MKVYKGIFRPWNTMKEEIERCLKTKEHNFVQKDKKKIS